MIKSHQFECNDLQDIMFAMEQEFNELKTEALHDFQSQKDEIKNKVLTLVYGFVISGILCLLAWLKVPRIGSFTLAFFLRSV